jgi:hypothetical protein
MLFELCERMTENGDVKEWAFYVIRKGTVPQLHQRPFICGVWPVGENDEQGRRLYEEGRQEAMWEVERLNRNGRPPGHR